MQAARPRYALIAEAEEFEGAPGWRFALLATDASSSMIAADREEGADRDRLVLLAAVRGLEALDQPSEVTLVARSTSVSRGLTRGLEGWRNNRWRWERFGRLEPIRDADLWRRIDQAMRHHTVRCPTWRGDRSDTTPEPRGVAAVAVGRGGPRDAIKSRFDSPAMVIVRSPRTRRRVRLAEPMACAG